MKNEPIRDGDFLFETAVGAECEICGISSFDHIHRAGTVPRDFERVLHREEVPGDWNYHAIERVLTDFKNGATYSDSIERVQAIIRGERDLARKRMLNAIEGW